MSLWASIHRLKYGGNADIFIKVNTIEELQFILNIAKQDNIQVNVIGNGTNLLVTDKGIRGIVIKLDFKEEKLLDEFTFEVGAGIPIIKLAKDALDKSLTGLEFASGIPGTVGGAIKMNAGAYGGEVKDIVYSTTYLDENFKIQTINNKEHKFSYRKSIFTEKENWIIISSVIKLKKGNREEIQTKVNQNRELRCKNQPLNLPNSGSIFKRGEDYIPAKLIDEAGLKGYSIGGASVSEKHAGFIVNTGNATATDILELIEHVKYTVYKKFNIKLQLEVKILGEQ